MSLSERIRNGPGDARVIGHTRSKSSRWADAGMFTAGLAAWMLTAALRVYRAVKT